MPPDYYPEVSHHVTSGAATYPTSAADALARLKIERNVIAQAMTVRECREKSLALTKIDEAISWLERV